jgi:hypothetical protein
MEASKKGLGRRRPCGGPSVQQEISLATPMSLPPPPPPAAVAAVAAEKGAGHEDTGLPVRCTSLHFVQSGRTAFFQLPVLRTSTTGRTVTFFLVERTGPRGCCLPATPPASQWRLLWRSGVRPARLLLHQLAESGGAALVVQSSVCRHSSDPRPIPSSYRSMTPGRLQGPGLGALMSLGMYLHMYPRC